MSLKFEGWGHENGTTLVFMFPLLTAESSVVMISTTNFKSNFVFYVLLTVHLSIILVTDQLTA